MIMDVSGVLNSIRSGGFQNPISNAVQSRLNAIHIPSVTEMTGLATAQSAISGVPVPSAGIIEAAQTSAINAVNSINNLLGHTNKLSGVDLTGNGTLATIAKTANAARSINGDKSCSTVLQAFGALHKATEYINDTLATINMIESLLLDIPRQAALIPTLVAGYIAKVADQIVADTQALAQAQLDVVQQSLAQHITSMLDDECLGSIASAVMTQPMRNEVDKVRQAAAEKIREARYGVLKK